MRGKGDRRAPARGGKDGVVIMENNLNRERTQLMRGIDSPADLWEWAWRYLGIRVPLKPVCRHHDAPMDYLWGAYREPARDMVVWASRGGGKTRLGAAATLLDLLHKPGVQVRILGGSLDQSRRMWDYLLPDLERLAGQEMVKANVGREVRLENGSRAAVLSQSQRAVRGLRVQKLRCDEVELFDEEVWRAAQFATRSERMKVRRCYLHAGESKEMVRGVIEGMSTFHKPWGLMSKVVERAQERGVKVLRWCVLDVLERCPPERECASCLLREECGGVAKERCDGFFRIEDAIAMKQRSSAEAWASEMCCRRPSTEGQVFGTFDRDVHVRERLAGEVKEMSLAVDFGFHMPFVCLWVATLADGRTHVVDEYVQSGRTVDVHMEEVEKRAAGKVRVIACDPAGSGPNDQTAISNVQLLRKRGYQVRTRHTRIAEGLEAIRFGLRAATGEPRLFVSPKCRRLIKALECYHYGEGGGESPLKDGEHDHLIDALRYHFVNRGRGEVRGRGY